MKTFSLNFLYHVEIKKKNENENTNLIFYYVEQDGSHTLFFSKVTYVTCPNPNIKAYVTVTGLFAVDKC